MPEHEDQEYPDFSFVVFQPLIVLFQYPGNRPMLKEADFLQSRL